MAHHVRALTATDAASTGAGLLPRERARSLDIPQASETAAIVQRMSLSEAHSIIGAWQDLVAHALEPNVFYEPAFALPAAKAFGRNVEVIAVWSTRMPERLIGFFPARMQPRRYGLGPRVLIGWTHPYAPLGTPLVDRDEPGPALSAWLDALAGDDGAAALLPYLPIEGPVAEALRSTIATRGAKHAAFGIHRRALLVPGADRAGYVPRAVSHKRRKELHRQRRRLSDCAPLVHQASVTPADVRAALVDFLALEAAGWKGRAGTAAAHDAEIAQFMRAAVSALAERSQARVEKLSSGGKPLAAAIVLRSGDAAWFWKVAHNETARRASPGVQMTLEVTRSLLEDASVTQADSCATPDHPMIDHVWRQRLTLADVLIAPATAPFRTLRALEHGRRRLITAAKWARARLRGV